MDWTPGYDVVTTAEVSNDYEIKITGTANRASDEKIFVFTVNNVNRPPILGTISDETVNENVAITQVNAGDTTNGDSDRDDDVITFSCYFDTTVGGGVDNTNDCSTLPGGGSFDTATGILNWTPSNASVTTAQATLEYEIRITGTANGDSDDEIFVITVNNVNLPPILGTINPETVNENVAITQVDAGDTTNGDEDRDNDTITYTCYYDTNVDSAVGATNDCTTLSGTASFDVATGILNWLPDNEAVTTAENSLAYEIKITGTANGQSDDEIFVITVNNVDRPPVLGAISNETVNETVAFTTVNAGDTTNGDLDRDLDVITYSCYFDTTVSTTVADTTECTGPPRGSIF